MIEEVWKPIPSHPGYEASSEGRIRSTPAISRTKEYKVLSQNTTRGYYCCQLNTVRRRVNRLVCEAFHGIAPSLKHEASHINNNRIDNKATNLEWKTSKENKANQPGKMVGKNNPRARLTPAMVENIRALRKEGLSLDKIHAQYLQVSRSTIAYLLAGKTWV